MDVSIIIVNYNTQKLLIDCISSIYQNTKDVIYEIIVVDNNSSDNSIKIVQDRFPKVITIKNNDNIGFGAANNKGLAIAKGKYIFYLNSDTVLLNNSVKIFYDYFENHKGDSIGALGCNLITPDRKTCHSYASFPTFDSCQKILKQQIFAYFVKAIFKILHLSYRRFKKQFNYSKYIGEVDYITGADLFVLNNSNAFFDEQFFMYYEETDLELQLSKKNLKRFIIDGPEIIHIGGASNKYTDDFSFLSSKSHIFQCISRIKYIRKNIGNKESNKIKLLTLFLFFNPLIKNRKEIRKEIRNA